MNSRVLITSLLGIVMCISSLIAQDTLVVSERVGKVLDEQECRYFGLFPDADPPREVILVRTGDGTVAAWDGGARIATMSEQVYSMLGVYMEAYDSLQYHIGSDLDVANIHMEYDPLISDDIVARIWERSGDRVSVSSSREDGTTMNLKGELLWADDRILLLRPDGMEGIGRAVSIPAGEVNRVCAYRNSTGQGAVAVGIIGAVVGLLSGLGEVSEKGDKAGPAVPVVGSSMVAYGMVGIAAGAAVGLMIVDEDCTDIEGAYHLKLAVREQDLRMYYANGPPPEMR